MPKRMTDLSYDLALTDVALAIRSEDVLPDVAVALRKEMGVRGVDARLTELMDRYVARALSINEIDDLADALDNLNSLTKSQQKD